MTLTFTGQLASRIRIRCIPVFPWQGERNEPDKFGAAPIRDAMLAMTNSNRD